MKIAIDCRYIGRSGIGRVCEGLLDSIDFRADEYYLIGKRAQLEKYPLAKIVEDDSDPYSVKGLFSFDRNLNKVCDAVFIPNFIVMYGIGVPVYTIMHDLAFLDVKETTRGVIDRTIKKTLLRRCMKRSRAISCVSEFTRSRCEVHFGKLARKCFVNYNGISESVAEYARTHRKGETDRSIVFVGNVKPHKGLNTLLAAFQLLDESYTLKIIGDKDTFLTGLKLDESEHKNVVFTGRLTDEPLFDAIQKAEYLVLPSVYEGFGLPPLEALCLGTQPIVSDIEVFHEVYEGLPVRYFSDIADLAEQLKTPPQSVDLAREIADRFDYRRSWNSILERIKRDGERTE